MYTHNTARKWPTRTLVTPGLLLSNAIFPTAATHSNLRTTPAHTLTLTQTHTYTHTHSQPHTRPQMDRSRADDDADAAIAEAELTKLQKQYRLAEGDRKSYNEKTQAEIRLQLSTIAKLQQDNDMLKRELGDSQMESEQKGTQASRADELKGKLQELEAEYQTLKAEQKDGELVLKTKQADYEERRKKVVAAQALCDPVGINRQIKIVENRLEKTLKKYNDYLTENAKLRQTIEHLKTERIAFDALHRKLDRELDDIKTAMADVIEKSNQAYEARDEAQSKILALKEKHDKEVAQYNIEVKELTRVLEHDRKLRSFMGAKGQDRVKELERTGRLSAIRKTTSSDKDKKPEETIQSYEEAFEKIKQATGIQNIDRLVNRFIEVEDQNFSLFNYVNELNNEIEMLQEKIAETKADIEKFIRQGEVMDNQRKKVMRELEDQLKGTESQTGTFQDKLQQAELVLDELKAGVESLFGKIGCDKSEISVILGNSTISDSNVMQFLGIIEQRTNELLQTQTLLDIHATQRWEKLESELRDKADAGDQADFSSTLGPKPKAGGLLGAGPLPAAQSIAIQAPSTGDDLDDDDQVSADEDDSRPLTHTELRSKILQGTSKRDQPAKTKNKLTETQKTRLAPR
eukprot:m.444391 g.444391  ORF g.444391 m.444391 type:complete len:632 (+) comp56834_c0_seq2:2057-3952(+)